MTTMTTRILGRSGLRVSELALGTMTFGDDWGWGADEATARAVFERYAEAGGNLVDTACNYTDGSSEQIVGRCVAGDRDRFVVATKYTLSTVRDDPNAGGNHRKSLLRTLRGSLERLGTDHVDLLYVHMWDDTTPLVEVLRGLDHVVRQGHVLHVAFSDTPAWVVSRAVAIAEAHGWSIPVAVQVPYSPLSRGVERDVLPMADALGLPVLAWGVLDGGLLTGKHLPGDVDGAREPSIPATLRPAVEGFVDIATRLDVPPAALALAWVRDHPMAGGPVPILGARTVDQLDDQLAVLDLELDQDVHDEVAALRDFRLDFPRSFLESANVRDLIHGDTWARLAPA